MVFKKIIFQNRYVALETVPSWQKPSEISILIIRTPPLEGHLRQPDCHVTRCSDLRHQCNDVIIVQTIYSSPW